MELEAGVPELGLHVAREGRRRVHVADEDEDDAVALFDRVGLEIDLADGAAAGLGDDLDELAVPNVEGEAVEPAGDGVLRVALGLGGEGGAAMAAAVFDRVDRATGALEVDALAEQHLPARLPLPQLLAEQGGVPVVAEAEFGVEVLLVGLAPLNLVDRLLRVVDGPELLLADVLVNHWRCLPRRSSLAPRPLL